MNDPEDPPRKTGRPNTRAIARRRTASLDANPPILRRLSIDDLIQGAEAVLAQVLPADDHVADEVVEEDPLAEDPPLIPPLDPEFPAPPAAHVPAADEMDEELPHADEVPEDVPHAEQEEEAYAAPPPPPGPVPNPQAPAPEDPQPDAHQQANRRLRREARQIIIECQEFIDIHEALKMNPMLLTHIKEEAARLAESISTCILRFPDDCAFDDEFDELLRWRRNVKEFSATMLTRFKPPTPTQAAQPDPPPQSKCNKERRDTSPDTLAIIQRDLVFFMSKLQDDHLPDIAEGADVSNAKLRDLHDVTLPQITRAIDDCRRVLNLYTNKSNYNKDLAMEAQDRCEDASLWTNDLVTRHRSQKMHLDKNTLHREIMFTAFMPGGDVSIYHFLSRFESWAEGYLSEEAKADQLFHRYLDKSIVETYAELISLQEDFNAMKDWLIKKYGSVVPMAHSYVRSIRLLEVPSQSDHSATVTFMRSIHRFLVSLSELEISKGVPVPKLQTYLGSNAFLSALVAVLPLCIQNKLFNYLIDEGTEDFDTIEGRHHLTKIIHLLRAHYRKIELLIQANPTAIATPPPQPPLAPSGPQQAKKPSKTHIRPQQTANVSNMPQNNNPPFLSGGNTTPLGNNRQNHNHSSTNRWLCPLRTHQDHNITECPDFWSMIPQARRDGCKFWSCFTCLEHNKVCRGFCTRIEEVPAELICPDCAQRTLAGKTPVMVLFCGIAGHRKPSPDDLSKSLEAWIPNLNLNSLGTAVRVNLTTLGFHSTSVMAPPPFCKTGPPTTAFSNMVYDTSTGEPRPISRNDHINKTSAESAFYAMQTLRIKDQDVLVFYDSGSNAHLIEGSLAERLRLDILLSENVPVGALGGKVMWSEYGKYTITLGPDHEGECHELEMQGIPSITGQMPEVNLKELWSDANSVLQGRSTLPPRIGGSRAQILIGIKSTHLSPKHKFTLPNGLGIYESVLYDIHQSNICFGGPHAVFTQAYKKAGASTSHIQVMFTELARSYMDSPRSFIRVDVDDHGPPLNLARELDLLEELATAFPPNQKIVRQQSILAVDLGISDSDTCRPSDTSDCNMEKCPEEIMINYDNLLDHCTHANCLKSTIPLSKLKGLQDELDIPEIIDFRCDSCANCPTCKLSARAKTKSLQESFEQEVIEKSVHVDMKEAKVWVDLPFIKEPVEYLSKKHSGPSNYNQALRIYQAQCRKRDEVKDQVRKAHCELVEKDYMQELSTLPNDIQELVNNAPFRHFYPWRAVYKEDSVTTPVRLVVDPTVTGLNEILAKGVNMLSKIPEILIKFRCHKKAWNTDISKLYNQLHLNHGSLPFSLFLYHESLDANTAPLIWVMSRAWYGVSSTGNQAGVALEFLANQFKEIYPAAHSVLISSRYVDDILSGADSDEDVEDQIHQTGECLKAGGFSMKYIARSGNKPPPKASNDGRVIGCLGLAWDTETDTLSLAFNEDFFLKRIKGQKPMPDLNLKDAANLNIALASNLMTRAGILSRVAELYDPCGWWEPIKVQMKLSLQHLNGLEWTSPVPPEHCKDWITLFNTMNQLKEVHIARSVVPETSNSPPEFRIIVVADAAAKACGCAIYTGVERPDGNYSCDLILAKSKMVHGTIPRNELEGLVLAAETSLTVQKALRNHVSSIRFYTDSRIVVCWVLNQSKRLRMWAYNRVSAIRSMMNITENGEASTPLFHINGIDNVADLLTKVRSVSLSDLQTTSAWYTGMAWMSLPDCDLPCDQFTHIPEDLSDLYNQETFQEVDNLNPATVNEERDILVASLHQTPIKDDLSVYLHDATVAKSNWFLTNFKFHEQGWLGAKNRLRLVLKACAIFKHSSHITANASWIDCHLCRRDPSMLQSTTDEAINWAASSQTEGIFPQKILNAKFHKIGNIWYSKSRLEKIGPIEIQDLDCSPFFDHQHLKKFLPIVFVKLDIFRSYLAFIHNVQFPHMGVENTLRRIKERFFPVGNARAVIATFRNQCSKCRLMIQKVVALELAQFPSARTTIAPPFWAVQIDIAMSFKARPTINSRKTFSCHALIIVCLLTSATSILVLDGLTTQAVVQAIERHSARYGVPGHIFVDSGTQLEKLQDTSFQLKDVHSNVTTQRFQVTIAVPKAHQQQGRAEAKIKVMRKMLIAWSKSNEECNTLIGWETIFAKVASAIDDIPIARGTASAPNDLGWEIITPNRLKIGRNNYRQLEGPIKLDNCPQSQLERNRLLTSKWYEIFIERLHLLIPPPAKEHDKQPEVGDVVLFVFTDPNAKKLWVWKLGVIEEKMSRSSYKIRYAGPDGKLKYVQRAAGQISIIVPVNQL